MRRKIHNTEDENGSVLQELFFVKNPVRLKGLPIAFSFSQYFRIVPSADGYGTQTEAYTYEIEDCHSRHELFAFHWEPNAPNSKSALPHLHLGFAHRDEGLRINNKAHIPTGRIELDDVVSFLIDELRVTPLIFNWRSVLPANRYIFADSGK